MKLLVSKVFDPTHAEPEDYFCREHFSSLMAGMMQNGKLVVHPDSPFWELAGPVIFEKDSTWHISTTLYYTWCDHALSTPKDRCVLCKEEQRLKDEHVTLEVDPKTWGLE